MRGRVRKTVVALVLVASLPVTDVAFGQWPGGRVVVDTVHNLSRTAQVSPMNGFIADYGEACVYCHAPHRTSTNRPLWNRTFSSTSYRMYESASLDMPQDPQPAATSRLCLSCHDGVLPLDRVIDRPVGASTVGGNGETIKLCATDCHTGGNPDGGLNWENVWFEPDLRKHHPISILYDPSYDPLFRPVAAVEAAGLRFVDGKLECVTCHEPHSQSISPFLRVSNTGGSLCSVCHVGGTGRTTAHFW
jgi:predicted CXXCH cytochrome family protein